MNRPLYNNYNSDEEDDIESLDDKYESYVCEDCDYRWDGIEEDLGIDEEYAANVCPMCGATNIVSI